MRKILSRFRNQLLLSYLPIVLAPVILVGLVTRGVAEQGLNLLVTQGARERLENLVPCLAEFYVANGGSWAGLNDMLNTDEPLMYTLPGQRGGRGQRLAGRMVFLEGGLWFGCFSVRVGKMSIPIEPGRFIPRDLRQGALPPSPPGMPVYGEMTLTVQPPVDRNRAEQLIITDPGGIITASTDPSIIGQPLATEALASAVPIVIETATGRQNVGSVVIGTGLNKLNEAQRQLLDTVNAGLVVSGGFSIALAVGLGWWMSWQIAQPVRNLMNGAARLAKGEWTAPLEVRSENEFGDLTRAFNSMASQITHQQQLNRQMVADVAHDLRTPLSAMALEVEAIEAGFQTPAQATASLREEITWLQRMVDDLRTLTLMDADQVHLQLETVSLPDYLAGVCDFWRTLAEDEGRCLTLDVPHDLPAAVLDPGRMRQVLGNLLDNAIRHTRPGDAITLRARANATSDVVLIQVIDEGEGVPPEHIPYIFDRFYRVDPARRRGGSGLGLSIARRLVEMHGGSISASSKLGHGTTFTLTLPVAAPAPA